MLLLSVICFNLAFVFGLSSAQDDIGCFVPGKCLNSDSVGISFPIDQNACLQDCKDNANCLYFTYEFADGLCTQLSSCDDLETTSPSESVSGSVNCYTKNDGSQHTFLDDYVFSEESLSQFRYDHLEEYDWNGVNHITNEPFTAYVLNMTSGDWQTEAEVGISSHWWHIFVIIIPGNAKPEYNSHGMIGIVSGKNTDNDDTGVPEHHDYQIVAGTTLATGIGMAVGVLFQVPNQPIVFASDPDQHHKSEDSLCAYSWQEHLKDITNPELNVYLPMARAGVRSMDAMTLFMEEEFGRTVDRFVMTGASKRGWAAWLMGVLAPERVVAIVPIVWDAINIQEIFHHQFMSFNGWTWALNDYLENNIMSYIDTPALTEMQNLIDPYFYRTRLTMPKLMITGLMDEFQMADDEQYWWDEMPSGPTGSGYSDGNTKWLIKSPNSDHSQVTDVGVLLPMIGIWTSYLLNGWDIPYLTWEYEDATGDVTAWAHGGEVVSAVMWHSTTCDDTRRDFRAFTLDKPCDCGFQLPDDGLCTNVATIWHEEVLTANPDGSYTGHMDPPTDGLWGAFIITIQMTTEHTKNSNNPMHNFFTREQSDGPVPETQSGWPLTPGGTFEFTSRASVVPNTFPYADCTRESCMGPLV